VETWKDYELAAVDRLWDAWAIAAYISHGATGAAYMLGYVAEMTLKAAFFRTRKTPASMDTWPLRKLVLVAANNYGVRQYAAPSAYHNIDALCDALAWERNSIGRPLGAVEPELRRHAASISKWWTVDLRYRSGQIGEPAVRDCWAGAEWLVANYALLH
jgi:hypothetical protein